ncbi:MAG TPA: MotB family protein [Paracoccaceae bacterium]|nr:MotB family protein [Paracoccaceae bacterium]
MNIGEQDLLIIRRRGSAELDTPKGGVWKIAYADFMTAMMAFFLVMWLVSATSESTRTGVANYFNPIKLSEGTHLPKKGLVDPELTEPGATDPAGQETPGPVPDPEARHETQWGMEAEPSRGKAARYSEAALFRDPYAVLAAIAAEAEVEATSGLDAGGTDQAPGATGELDRIGSEPYRDPFDPPARTPGAPLSLAQAAMPPGAEAEALARRASEAGQGRDGIADVLAARDEPAAIEAQMAGGPMSGAGAAGTGGDTDVVHARSGPPHLAERLLEGLTEAAKTHAIPNVSVTSGDDGVLISLSDQVDFGMFAIGSAEPLPATIAAMTKIAEILKEVPGQVIIRGHTDGRPFRSDTYDNWRLSAARAHMAYYMLLRGGLDEERVRQIEGHADRDLKVPSDPEAAENRRIEILVQGVQS